MIKEQKVGFMTKIWQGLKSNRIVQAEKENLTSVRVKLTYAIAIVWTTCVITMFRLIWSILKTLEPEQKVIVVPVIMEKILSVFYVVSFIFFTILMIYVLKRTNFKLEFFGIKLDMSENKIDKQITNQQDDATKMPAEVK